MINEICAGCGREITADMVSCPGCSRPLDGGTAVPPGWGVTVSARSTLPQVPRWRLAGLDTARPLEGPEDTAPQTPAELFRPRDTGDFDPTITGGPGWRVRPRQPRPLVWQPAAAAVAASVTVTRTASRIAYWTLVGGILATSSAAVLLLMMHMVRGR